MKKTFAITDIVCTILGFILIIVAFCSLAPYRIEFKEQIGIFLIAPERFSWYISHPAVIASIIGDFFTQFFMSEIVAVTVSVLLLVAIAVGLGRFTTRLNGCGRPLYMVLLLPIILEGYFLTFPNYPLSATVGLAIAVWGANAAAKYAARTYCYILLPLVPIVFIIAGAHAFTCALMLLVLSLKNRYGFRTLFSIIAGAALTIVIARFYNLTTIQTFCIPITLGYILPDKLLIFAQPLFITMASLLSIFTATHKGRMAVVCGLYALTVPLTLWLYGDNELEYSVKIGTKAYLSEWDDVRELYSSKTDNMYGLYYRNLSYAREGLLADELLSCEQNRASDGLFLKTGQGDNVFSMIYFTDALLEIGDLSTATDCALLAQTIMPGGYSTRMLIRLAQISITAGDYEVARKYLDVLSRTIMHKEWASDMMRCIERDSLPENYLIWRARTSDHDHLFVQGDIRSSIRYIIQERPYNKVAIDYLLCSLLLEKRLNTFVEYYDKYYYDALDRIVTVPELYHEALLVNANSDESLKAIIEKYHVGQNVVDRYMRFLSAQNNASSTVSLSKEMERTYWGYITSVRLNNSIQR